MSLDRGSDRAVEKEMKDTARALNFEYAAELRR